MTGFDSPRAESPSCRSCSEEGLLDECFADLSAN